MPTTIFDNNSTTSVAPNQDNPVTLQAYYFKCYTPLAVFLGSAESAMLLQRIHYWLQNTKAGFRLKDGSKWIYNGYKEWQEQMPWLSTWQIGRLVRELEATGWLLTERFYSLKDSVGFAQRTPGWHDDNQRKWYRINYVKIFEDTGFDLLFDCADQSTPPEPMAETLENSQCANLHNATCNSAQSSIYQSNTKELSRESEKEGIEINTLATETGSVELNPPPRGEEEGWEKTSTLPDQDKCSAPPRNKTSKIVRNDHMFTPELRPARQDPRLRYPEGPWLTETGCLNGDFVRDRANLWRTGDTPKSQAFGRMALEEVMALVCGYYAKLENQANLEIHWAAYVAKNQRYLSNVRERLDAGINIPPREQQQVLAKLPAVLSAPVESVYESATIHASATIHLLPSSLDQLPAMAAATGRSAPLPEDGENFQAYQSNVNPEDVEWMQRFKAVPPKKKPKPTTDDW